MKEVEGNVVVEDKKDVKKAASKKKGTVTRKELNDSYISRKRKKESKMVEALAAQKSAYDKYMFVVTWVARESLYENVMDIDVETLKKNGMPGSSIDYDEEMFTSAYEDILTVMLGDGKLEDFKKLYETYSMILGKAYYDLGTYYKEMYDSLPVEDNDEMRKSKAMYLTLGSGCMGYQLYSSFIDNLAITFEHFTFDNNVSTVVGSKAEYNKIITGVQDRIIDNLGSEGKELFRLGRDMAIKGKGAISMKDDPEFKEWVKNVGKAKSDELFKKNTVANFKLFNSVLYSKKPINIITNKGVSELFNEGDYNEKVMKANTIEYILNVLQNEVPEDAKDHKNSKEYDNMIKCIEKYIKAVKTRSGGREIVYEREMKDSIYAYIKGKKSYRSSELGNQRFEACMVILSEIEEEYVFDRLVSRVNEVRTSGLRSLKSDQNKHLVDADNYRADFSNYRDIARFDVNAMNSLADRDYVVEHNERAKDKLWGATKEFRHEAFNPIGIAKENGRLSKGDYYALLTSAVLLGDDNDKAKETIKIALDEYHQGKKAKLADVIAKGIKILENKAKGCDEVTIDEFNVNSEFAYRLVMMLDRDRELRKYALGSGISLKDITYVNGMKEAADIWEKAYEAEEKIKSSLNYDPDNNAANGDFKIERATDIYMLKVINDSIKQAKKAKYDVNIKGADSKTIDIISDPDSIPAIRENVKKLLIENGFKDKSLDDILNECRKPNSLVELTNIANVDKTQKNTEEQAYKIITSKSMGTKKAPVM